MLHRVGVQPIVIGIVLTIIGQQSHSQTPAPTQGAAVTTEKPPAGNWRRIESRHMTPRAISDEEREALESLGYAGGYEKVVEQIGVTKFDKALAYPGCNVFVSGHGPEAWLSDMDGKVLHTWTFDSAKVYPVSPARNYWRRVHVAANGDLFALVDPHGIIKIDKNSKLIWSTDPNLLLHHDFFVTDEGTIYAIGRESEPGGPEFPVQTMLADNLVILSEDGKLIDRISLRDSFAGTTDFNELMARIHKNAERSDGTLAEDLHTNTVQVFDGSAANVAAELKKGNVMLCSPITRNVWIYDPSKRQVVWNWFGPWQKGIHHATLLPNGHFLLFDNCWYDRGPEDIASRVIEYDLPTRAEIWSYPADPKNVEELFSSTTSSTAERLPNGNTLVVISEMGVAVEVTVDHRIVWKYYNPKRAGEDNEFIATLFQVDRLPLATTNAWLAQE